MLEDHFHGKGSLKVKRELISVRRRGVCIVRTRCDDEAELVGI